MKIASEKIAKIQNNVPKLFKIKRQINIHVRNQNIKFQTFMFYISQ